MVFFSSTSVALALLAANGASASESAAFEAALAQHITAIQQRDMAGMEATITSQPDLDLIFPNGKHTGTRAEFLSFHREWFADKNWSMSFERKRVTVGKDIAVALYRSGYTDTSKAVPETRYSWLNLSFRKEGRKWVLFHDQNTRIPESK